MDDEAVLDGPDVFPDQKTDPSDLAYLIFTSGSTGMPKGVMIEHRSMCNFIHWYAREHHIDPAGRCAEFAAFSFDVSVVQVFAPLVAEGLSHANWVAPGWSRKRWYEDALSVPASSSTAPTERRLWLDPRVRHRLDGRRVLLVDDVISTGSSALAGVALLERAGVRPAGLLVAMAQGDRWRAAWPADIPVRAAFATPVFARVPGGWMPRPDTAPRDLCPLFPRKDAA